MVAKIVYPNPLFGHNIIDGHGGMCSVLTHAGGSNQGMGDVEFGEIHGIYFLSEFLRLSMARPATSWAWPTRTSTDDFTGCVGALAYYIGPESEECKIACPNLPFDRSIIDGRGMMCSVLTLAVGNNQGMGDVEYGRSATSASRRSSCASSMARPGTSWG